MSPDSDNAWATYRKVLTLNPNNKQAQNGIDQIKEVYMGWAKEKMNNGDDIQALHYLNRASAIAPNDPEILAEYSKIQKTAVAKSKSVNPKLDSNLYRLLDEPNGIPKLLALAKQQIAEKNLTKPVNNSAFSIYQLILKRFPEHPQALAGVQKVKSRYLSWAKYEIKYGKLSHAEYLYSKALEISPSDPQILSDLDQLRQTTKPL
jgi:tetratricopeptide (TPR) repeat protein